jgi:biopolymer transport protein ExbB
VVRAFPAAAAARAQAPANGYGQWGGADHVIEYIIAGGPVMIPIGISSVVGLAVFLERMWSLRRSNVAPPSVIREVTRLAREGKFEDALAVCRRASLPVTRLMEIPLAMRGATREVIKERIEELGRREASELERFISVLTTVGALGPLLGLLGTVGGMILTFQTVQQSANADVHQLAGGIAQALVTTFGGLCVAIPAVAVSRYLLARVDSLVLELEEASLTLLDVVIGKTA